MAQKTIVMSLIKQVQQLRQEGVAIKEIVRRVGLSRKTVKKYLCRLENLSLQSSNGQPLEMTDKELAATIYNNDTAPVCSQREQELLKHFEHAKKERHKTGVNKQILWMEYLETYPDGYKYSQYCNLLKKYLKNTDSAFHWEYNPGEFIQIDFAGKKLSYVNKQTVELIKCQVFVAILPYSGLIFCYAVHSQKTDDFVTCINVMVKYIGGLSKTILCDNLKTAVTKSDLYQPIFTDICYQLSDHYNTTFSATRPRTPSDKGMVERAVNIVYTNIYAPMRKKTAGSLEELNAHIAGFLDLLNVKNYKGTSESRRDIFTREELPLLKELPQTPYLLKKYKKVIVQRNYFIQLPDNKHYYSVPYQHVGRQVTVYFNQRTVEVYYDYERIALHIRSSTEPKFNRIHEHMPKNHQHMVETQGWTTEDLLERAGWVGPYTLQAAERIIHSSFYPEQNFKACNVMLLLQNKYSKLRLEAACLRAANVTRPTLKLITNILAKGLDKQPLLFDLDNRKIPVHENIRGSGHYR
jgi:transposase